MKIQHDPMPFDQEAHPVSQINTHPLTEGVGRLAQTTRGISASTFSFPHADTPVHIQNMLNNAFAVQCNQLVRQAGSSSNVHLNALKVLKQRGFRPAVGGLEIRLSGKGLGGADDELDSDESWDDADDEAAWESQVNIWRKETQVSAFHVQKLANDLHQLNLSIASESAAHPSGEVRVLRMDSLDNLEKELSDAQKQLRDAKQSLAYFQGLLKDAKNKHKHRPS